MSHPLQPPPISRPTTPTPNSSLPLLTTTTSRVSTAPVKSKHHHIPHHPHRLHHHHHRDKSVPQSAVQPPSAHPFGDSLNPVTKTTSRGEYEREAALAQEKLREMKAKEDERQAKIWKVVERKREGRKRVDEHLRQTLLSLTTLSTAITRRLDYTYYSLLEHVSILDTLTSHLFDLASTSSSLHSTFHTATAGLNATYSTQIRTSNSSFQAQAERIEALERRLENGKNRVGALGQRLEGVRGKVKGWERKEREWQERVRMRLRMLWGSISFIVGIFVILLVVRCWPRAPQEPRTGNNHTLKAFFDMEREKVVLPAEEGEGFARVGEKAGMAGKGGIAFPTRKEGGEEEEEEEEEGVQAKNKVELGDDPRLRIFDEL